MDSSVSAVLFAKIDSLNLTLSFKLLVRVYWLVRYCFLDRIELLYSYVNQTVGLVSECSERMTLLCPYI